MKTQSQSQIGGPKKPLVKNLDWKHFPEGHEKRLRHFSIKFEDICNWRFGETIIKAHRTSLEPSAQPVKQIPLWTLPVTSELGAGSVEHMRKGNNIDLLDRNIGVIYCHRAYERRIVSHVQQLREYVKLNAVTIYDSYPLLRMDESINSLKDAPVS